MIQGVLIFVMLGQQSFSAEQARSRQCVSDGSEYESFVGTSESQDLGINEVWFCNLGGVWAWGTITRTI